MHILYLSIRQEVPDNNNRTTLSVVGRLQPHSKQEMQHFCGKAYHGLGSDLMYLYLHRVGILTCNKVCHFIFACDCGILVCARARHSYVAVIWLFSSSELFFAVIRIFFYLFQSFFFKNHVHTRYTCSSSEMRLYLLHKRLQGVLPWHQVSSIHVYIYIMCNRYNGDRPDI